MKNKPNTLAKLLPLMQYPHHLVEAHLTSGLWVPDLNNESDYENATPHNSKRFRSHFHVSDIFRSNILWNFWVERCKIVIGDNSIFYSIYLLLLRRKDNLQVAHVTRTSLQAGKTTPEEGNPDPKVTPEERWNGWTWTGDHLLEMVLEAIA